MKYSIKIPLLIISFALSNVVGSAQPIPVELALGYKYGTVNLTLSKSLSPESRIGFFHMNTVQFEYGDETRNSFLLQDLLYVETIKNIRLAGGVAYSKGGLNPTAGLQYGLSGQKLMILIAPRVNIKSDLSYDIMTILQYKPEIGGNLKLFSRIQALNLFNSGGNIKSYQWMRIGLERKGVQFGVAFNLDEYGPDPAVEINVGLFIRKEIF